MDATYAFRRVYINEERRQIGDIVRKYPCLSEQGGKNFFIIIVITAGTCTK